MFLIAEMMLFDFWKALGIIQLCTITTSPVNEGPNPWGLIDDLVKSASDKGPILDKPSTGAFSTGMYDDGNRMVLDETHLVEGSFSSGSARIHLLVQQLYGGTAFEGILMMTGVQEDSNSEDETGDFLQTHMGHL
ncbi:hypothetical protein ACJX0J_021002, partial [Zea mays]